MDVTGYRRQALAQAEGVSLFCSGLPSYTKGDVSVDQNDMIQFAILVPITLYRVSYRGLLTANFSQNKFALSKLKPVNADFGC